MGMDDTCVVGLGLRLPHVLVDIRGSDLLV